MTLKLGCVDDDRFGVASYGIKGINGSGLPHRFNFCLQNTKFKKAPPPNNFSMLLLIEKLESQVMALNPLNMIYRSSSFSDFCYMLICLLERPFVY